MIQIAYCGNEADHQLAESGIAAAAVRGSKRQAILTTARIDQPTKPSRGNGSSFFMENL